VPGENLRRDAAFLARRDERADPVGVVVGDGHEQSATVFKGPWRDAAQYPVLLDAFDRGLRVCHRVPGPAVQQAVMSSGRAGRELAALENRDGHAAQREVMGERGTCAAATDHHNLLPHNAPPVQRAVTATL
jgi:hypothetical protein